MIAVDFIQSFDKIINYILYAVKAYQRFKVKEKISYCLKLQQYSTLTDISDKYKDLIIKILLLKYLNPKVLKASEIIKDIKRNKLKRAVLAKKVMIRRKVNKILDILKE